MSIKEGDNFRELQPINLSGNIITSDKDDAINKVQMKKQLGLLEGVAIILGIILGSGKNLFKKKLLSNKKIN